MKVSAKQYARSLFELVADKSDDQAKSLIADFISFLYRRQDLNKAGLIITELESLYEEAVGEVKVELISARPLHAAAKSQITTYLQKRAGIAAVNLQESLSPDLLGGFVLRYNGLVIDGSLQNNLRKFKKQFLTN
jgi:F-type H+-transporting ATPase subunit delta